MWYRLAMRIAVLLACLIGCVDSEPAIGACEPTADCCDLLPDRDAVGACIQSQLSGTDGCGVYVCRLESCELERVPFCVGQAS